jgi:hypothetical protein
LSGHKNGTTNPESINPRRGVLKKRAEPRENIDKTSRRVKKRPNEMSEEPTKKNKISRLRENRI